MKTAQNNLILAAGNSWSWLQSTTAGTRTSTAATHTQPHTIKPLDAVDIELKLLCLVSTYHWYFTVTLNWNTQEEICINQTKQGLFRKMFLMAAMLARQSIPTAFAQ